MSCNPCFQIFGHLQGICCIVLTETHWSKMTAVQTSIFRTSRSGRSKYILNLLHKIKKCKRNRYRRYDKSPYLFLSDCLNFALSEFRPASPVTKIISCQYICHCLSKSGPRLLLMVQENSSQGSVNVPPPSACCEWKFQRLSAKPGAFLDIFLTWGKRRPAFAINGGVRAHPDIPTLS